jgi:hypothetical protein
MATGVGGTDGERHAGFAGNDRLRRQPARSNERASFGDFQAAAAELEAEGLPVNQSARHPPAT